MPQLSRLQLENVNLGRGEVDDLNFLHTLVNSSHLEFLNLRDNYFGGILPHSIANLSTTLRSFDFSNNQISGGIPLGLGNRVSLKYIELNDNQFTGTIPDDIGNIPMLQYAMFSNNQLSGSNLLSLGNLSWLSLLELSNNNFEGMVPPTFGNCTSLLYLYLSQNNIVGNVPHQVLQAPSLISISLYNNYLQGSLPSEIGNLKNLVSVDMSYNNLSGTIPTSIGQCLFLTEIYLYSNAFVGFIPPSFSLLDSLQILDLSSNKLSGKLPKYLSNISSLTILNLSFNNLEGEVPTKGVFANLSAIIVNGNSKLCGGITVITRLTLPNCASMKTKGKKKPHAVIISAIISCDCWTGYSVFCLFPLHKNRRENPTAGTLYKEQFIKVSYDMLLKATDGFSPRNLIGSGSFGSVYRGALLLGGIEKVFAIKVINNQRRGADKSFMAECEALRIIRHRNLVGVITACSSIDFEGNVFKALVYKLMLKGSIERCLYPNPEDYDQLQNLSLLQRLNIVIDVAHALDYIHNGNDTSIIHCYLKPTNILLDEDMTAHVGDFGLVKLIPEISEQLHNSSSIGVRGTIGYAALQSNIKIEWT